MAWRNPNYRVDIFAKTQKWGTLTLSVRFTDTVRKMKELIEEQIGVETWRQKLCFAGKVLKNESAFCEIGLQKEATLYMIVDADQRTESKCAC